MMWLLLAAPLAFIYGVVQGRAALRKGRRPLEVDGAILSWQEAPRSIFWQDRQVGLVLTAHAVFLLLLAVVGLRVCLVAWEVPLPEYLQPVRWLYFGGLTLTVLYTWMAAGSALAFPVFTGRIGPVTIHLLADGVLHGRVKVPWEKIGWTDSVPASRGLLLRSRRNREITLLGLAPPTNDLYDRANVVTRERIGRPPFVKETSTREKKSTFSILMMAGVVPVFLIGLFLISTPFVGSFLFFGLAMYLSTTWGARVIRYYFS